MKAQPHYRVHFRDSQSQRNKSMDIWCLAIAQELAMRRLGQIIDPQGVIIPRDTPEYCLQCKLTHT